MSGRGPLCLSSVVYWRCHRGRHVHEPPPPPPPQAPRDGEAANANERCPNELTTRLLVAPNLAHPWPFLLTQERINNHQEDTTREATAVAAKPSCRAGGVAAACWAAPTGPRVPPPISLAEKERERERKPTASGGERRAHGSGRTSALYLHHCLCRRVRADR